MFHGKHILSDILYLLISYIFNVVLQISVRNFRPKFSEQEGQEERKMETVCTINWHRIDMKIQNNVFVNL